MLLDAGPGETLQGKKLNFEGRVQFRCAERDPHGGNHDETQIPGHPEGAPGSSLWLVSRVWKVELRIGGWEIRSKKGGA